MWSLLLSIAMANPGLTGGDRFTATPISGPVMITCQDAVSGIITRTFTCYQNLLEPGDYDYFVHPFKPKADQVDLQVLHEDGSRKSRMAGYDARTGLSTSRFNLWVRSLTQAPLLNLGLNKVSYILSKAGQDIESGSFEVMVDQGPARTCVDTGVYTSPRASDCNSPVAICARYFAERNNCRSLPTN
ncbi:MAG: hypothetical protein KF681_11485 [Bdellovibrionaceae bacterium]|nr:hypothetical protein [Pseudobdellovibrionaceae bacterium]